MKPRRSAITDSVERCTAIFPGSHTMESRSRWAKRSRAAMVRAYVLFPEPELPKTRTFIRPNKTSGCVKQSEVFHKIKATKHNGSRSTGVNGQAVCLCLELI